MPSNTDLVPELIYRPVRSNDGPRLHAFWLGMSEESQRTYRPYGDEGYLSGPWVKAAEQYGAGPDIGIVAVAPDGSIAGLCAVDRMAGPGLPVFGIGVDDRYHHRGVGSRLMKLVLGAADACGAPYLELSVVSYNAPCAAPVPEIRLQLLGRPQARGRRA